ILSKGALVFLQLEIVLVFGKILGHGNELLPDVVPPVQHLIGSRARGARRLILRLALAVKIRPGDGEQSDRKERKRKPLHGKFLLWIDDSEQTTHPREGRPAID